MKIKTFKLLQCCNLALLHRFWNKCSNKPWKLPSLWRKLDAFLRLYSCIAFSLEGSSPSTWTTWNNHQKRWERFIQYLCGYHAFITVLPSAFLYYYWPSSSIQNFSFSTNQSCNHTKKRPKPKILTLRKKLEVETN